MAGYEVRLRLPAGAGWAIYDALLAAEATTMDACLGWLRGLQRKVAAGADQAELVLNNDEALFVREALGLIDDPLTAEVTEQVRAAGRAHMDRLARRIAEITARNRC